jgi:hypothetical protein
VIGYGNSVGIAQRNPSLCSKGRGGFVEIDFSHQAAGNAGKKIICCFDGLRVAPPIYGAPGALDQLFTLAPNRFFPNRQAGMNLLECAAGCVLKRRDKRDWPYPTGLMMLRKGHHERLRKETHPSGAGPYIKKPYPLENIGLAIRDASKN